MWDFRNRLENELFWKWITSEVKQHLENSEDCPCVENEQNVENFNDIPHHLRKKRSNECRTRSSGTFQPKIFKSMDEIPTNNSNLSENGHKVLVWISFTSKLTFT